MKATATINRATLQAMAADSVIFRRHVLVDCDGVARPFEESADPRMLADLAPLDNGWRQVVAGRSIPGAIQRGYWERGRAGAKTTSQALSIAWPMFASRRPLALIAAAADRDQGKLIRDAFAKLVAINPFMRDLFDVQTYRIVRKPERGMFGSTLDILSNDVASSWGHTPDALLIDELTSWGDRRDLFDSLYSAIGKRKHAMMLITSNAGMGMGVHWTWTVRETARVDPAWHFSRWDSPSYWIAKETLDEQRRMLPSYVYSRVWDNNWIALGQALVPEVALSRGIRLSGEHYHLLHPDGSIKKVVAIKDCTRILYCDPAGSSADKDAEGRGKSLSWSVITIIDRTPDGDLAVIHVTRKRCEVPQLLAAIDADVARWRPSAVCTENAGIGLAVYSLLRQGKHGGMVRALEPKGRDKLTRFSKALNMLEQGRFYFDRDAEWFPALRTELLTLSGASKDCWDQADTLAYAAMDVQENFGPVIVPSSGAFIMGRNRTRAYNPFGMF